ncbi:MAG: ribonuclease P protein component [Bacteroidetes bacterium 4484_249]|nr:MAG: ribonuclease P protein component [Bacteroidetes bacterium 4484_249]
MQTFNKDERLSAEKIIDKLFSGGKSFLIYPYRVVWMEHETNAQYPAQILISVSKKKFKKAVDRNLIKRRTREAYRKNKSSFYKFLNNQNKNCVFALIYTANEIALYKEIERKINLILQRLQSEYEKDIR